jgi:hypothetical protein
MPLILKVESVASCAAPNIQHAASNESHRLAGLRGPSPKRVEVHLRPARQQYCAVVALDCLKRRFAVEMIHDLMPEGVIFIFHDLLLRNQYSRIDERVGF